MYKLLMVAFATLILSGCMSTSKKMSDYDLYVSNNYSELNCGVFFSPTVEKVETGYADITIRDTCVDGYAGVMRTIVAEIEVNEQRRSLSDEEQICVLIYAPTIDRVKPVRGKRLRYTYFKAAGNKLTVKCE